MDEPEVGLYLFVAVCLVDYLWLFDLFHALVETLVTLGLLTDQGGDVFLTGETVLLPPHVHLLVLFKHSAGETMQVGFLLFFPLILLWLMTL